MKKIIVMPDSFKGTMSSHKICEIMKTAIHKHYPACDVISVPVADGGEGTVDAFLEALGGQKRELYVHDPYMQKITGFYAMLPNKTAIIEMAAAAGLPLVEDNKNPCKTTTFGVGELILDAAKQGAKNIVIGLGGSATNDAACGLAAACGIRFFNAQNESFIPTGDTLSKIQKIDTSTLNPLLKNIPLTIMCDIDNPFYGKDGAAFVYAPQKGADPAMVKLLDDNLRHLASLFKSTFSIDVQTIAGSGAAGGMGGGLIALFNAKIEMGIQTVLRLVNFSTLLDGADFVYTGEGKLDSQSLRGKVVLGIAREACKKNVPVIAFVGDIGDVGDVNDIGYIDNSIENAYNEGLSAVFSINRLAIPYAEAKKRAEQDLFLTVETVLRYHKIVKNI